MNHKFLTDKKDIEAWLSEYCVNETYLEPHEKYGWAVTVHNWDLDLSECELDFIPVKFAKIHNGFLDVSKNKLTSLEFCPEICQSFCIDDNLFESLEGCPRTVNGHFNASNNRIKSLKGMPSYIYGEIVLLNNDIQSILSSDLPLEVDIGCINLTGNKKIEYLSQYNLVLDLKAHLIELENIKEQALYIDKNLDALKINDEISSGSLIKTINKI